jgi:hypothetical protein
MFLHWWWALSDLQLRHLPGVYRRRFHVGGGRSQTFSFGTSRRPAVDVFTLVVGAPGPSALPPPGGRSRTFSSGTFRGPAVNVFTLVVGAPEPSAPAPPGGPPLMFSHWWWVLPDLQLWHLPGARRQRFYFDGGLSQTFSSDTSRGHAVDVFMLMVGASVPLALAPPEGPHSTFSH